MCVNESALADHLAHGDFVGNCSPNCVAPTQTRGAIVESGTKEVTPVSPHGLRVKVIPNPSRSYFSLDVESGSNEKVVVIVYDVLGRIVKHIENNEQQLIRFGEDLKAGAYMAIVKQGNNTKTVKLVKQ